jgi:hypothetical protein
MANTAKTDWRIYISHDCCNDFTWGNDEASTRDNLAEILKAHLDAMTQTDSYTPDEQSHYTSTTFVEALCFLEKYPARREELVRRAIERRLTLSPWLCNTLWGSMTVEGNLRAMSAARRLQIATGIPLDSGNHSEMPSLPIGAATMLKNAGVDWIVVPWLLFDTVWATLVAPPVFRYVGPDGTELAMIFDSFASNRGLYIQGLKLLNNPAQIPEWIAHYEGWKTEYPLRSFFAAGTHHDLYPEKRHEVEPLNAKLCAYNQSEDRVATMVNASLGRFVDEVGNPNLSQLPIEKRSFGIGWEAWPTGLAKIWADGKAAERAFYDAETLLSLAILTKPLERDYTEGARYRADDVIAMLGEHAWNGMDERSHRINQQLRRNWGQELKMLGENVKIRAQKALATESDRPWETQYTLFNPLGCARSEVITVTDPINFTVSQSWKPFIQQEIYEDGAWKRAIVTPEIPAFGSVDIHESNPTPMPAPTDSHATATRASNAHFALEMDTKKPGIAKLTHKATGTELRVGDNASRNIGETVWYAGREIPLTVTDNQLISQGAVLTRLAQTATGEGIVVTTTTTLYQAFDYLDIHVRIAKNIFHAHERVTQVFPVGDETLVQTPGAFVWADGKTRPNTPHPIQHPNADITRIATDGLFRITHPNGYVGVATREAFLLRPDLASHGDAVSIECMGNDQNSPEVSADQGGERVFDFHYRLRFDTQDESLAPLAQWAKSFQHPVQMLAGKCAFPSVQITPEPGRIVTHCLKPALDGNGFILRFGEVSGASAPVKIALTGFASATQTDLLERDQTELPIVDGAISVSVKPWGLTAIRLMA